MSENTGYKVDYKVISNRKCPNCGFILKQNKVDRSHKYCYHCFKLKTGKRFFFEKGIKIDRLEIQKSNRVVYDWS